MQSIPSSSTAQSPHGLSENAIETCATDIACQQFRKPVVSAVRQVLTDVELEIHIFHCERLWKAAYARFQTLGHPKDRDEALVHLHAMNQAVLSRSAASQAAAHAAFERRLDNGVDYFQVAGARDRAMLERRQA